MKAKTAIEIMQDRYGKNPEFARAVEREKRLSDEDPSVVFARMAKQVRKKLKIPQETVAELLEVSQPRVSQMESGQLKGIQIESFIEYFVALGCGVTFHIDLPAEYANEPTSSIYQYTFSAHKSEELR